MGGGTHLRGEALGWQKGRLFEGACSRGCLFEDLLYMKKLSFSSRLKADVSRLWHLGASRAQPWT